MKNLLIVLFVSFSFFILDGCQAQEVEYLSTGVGEGNRTKEYPNYSLKLLLFQDGGAYLANVKVEIKDNKDNEILSTIAEGPWFFVDLKPGEYQVIATRKNGDKQGARFSVKPGQQTEIGLSFPKI